MTMVRLALIAMFLPLAATIAVSEGLRSEDPIEQRVKAVATDLRCPVCQGESVYDSHSSVAGQMKTLIREQIAAGKSDHEVKSFFVERYGEFVLMEPRASWRTALVWIFPGAAFFGGTVLLLLLLRRRTAARPSGAAEAMDVDTQDLINRIERLGP